MIFSTRDDSQYEGIVIDARQRNQAKARLLFVETNEEDTAFLTKGLAVQVKQAARLARLEVELQQGSFDAVLMDVNAVARHGLPDRRRRNGARVFVIAERTQVPAAIEQVRKGADGFLVKGISKPESLMNLLSFASRRSSFAA